MTRIAGASVRSRPGSGSAAPVERASPADRAFWAMDVGPVPQQLAVVLRLEGGLDLTRLRSVLGERIPSLPRLRQRLVRVPFGCGAPVWVDDAGFDVDRHVDQVACRPPGDEQALADTALEIVMTPLPRDLPLWSARLVTGLDDGDTGLVVTLHHALADGVGGLNVLVGLLDPEPASGARLGADARDLLTEAEALGAGEETRDDGAAFPRRPPSSQDLLRDSLAGKVRALRGAGRSWSLLRASLGASGGLRPPRITDCSLMRPTGPRRAAVLVHTEREGLREGAHRHGASTNDAVLVAVAGALARVLACRGEQVGTLVVAVPVSGRAPDGGSGVGNLVSPLLVPVPTRGDLGGRLAAVAAQVRARKADASGPAPIALLGWLFRPLAARGGYRWYLDHQHRFHTLVSHVRGPAEPVRLAGARVVSAVPLGVGEAGNSTAYAEVLSYAGTITVTAIVDPDHFPDLDVLAEELRAELAAVAAPALAR